MSTRRPSVSVVMAACNGARWLNAQIESILPQLDQTDELIISLDPSDDGSRQVIEACADPRIRLQNGPGKGVQANFENAISQARREILFLCDQDDVWKPDKVRRVLSAFENEDVVAVVHDAAVTDADLNLLEPSFYAMHGTRHGFLDNFICNSFIGCCMAFRASLCGDVLPFPARLPMHDQWIGLLALKKGKVVWLEEPLIDYRRHESNASSLRPASVRQQLVWRLRLGLALIGRMRALKAAHRSGKCTGSSS